MSQPAIKPNDDLISIPLHPKHWVIILASLEATQMQARQRVDELKKQGIDHTTLPDPMISALVGPTIVRGIITKELTAHGIMKPEANEAYGIDRIMEQIRKYRKDI